jgi:hypothetical protein
LLSVSGEAVGHSETEFEGPGMCIRGPTPKPLPLGYGEAMLTIGPGPKGQVFINAVRSNALYSTLDAAVRSDRSPKAIC